MKIERLDYHGYLAAHLPEIEHMLQLGFSRREIGAKLFQSGARSPDASFTPRQHLRAIIGLVHFVTSPNPPAREPKRHRLSAGDPHEAPVRGMPSLDDLIGGGRQ